MGDSSALRLVLAVLLGLAFLVMLGWFRADPGEDSDHVPSSDAASTAYVEEG